MMRFLPFFSLLLLPLFGAQNTDRRAPQKHPGGTDYALFFAVENYEHTSSWEKLDGPVKECEAIAKDLRELYGFETKVVKNPTLEEIDKELERWRAMPFPNPDDQLFIFFSGHGQFVEERGQGYFIPRDGKPSVGSIYERRWLPFLDLRRSVTTIKCRHILLAIDACFSGTADERIALKNENDEWDEPADAETILRNQRIHDQLRCKSRFLMTSGSKTKTENPSKFAASFRKAFASLGGKDQIVRPSDITEEWAGLTIQPHSATFEGHEACGEFLFVYQQKVEKTPEKPTVNDPMAGSMVHVEGGTFQMGKYHYNGPVHEVELSSFWISKYEVTNSEFCSFLNAMSQKISFGLKGDVIYCEGNPIFNLFYRSIVDTCGILPKQIEYDKGREAGGKFSVVRGFENHPVVFVSWFGATAFCEWLSNETGRTYHLPTEAQWEFAARGGNQQKGYKFAGSDNLKEVGWYSDNSKCKTHIVGGLKANEVGLFDLCGNVWEWCFDWYNPEYYMHSPRINPNGPKYGETRVTRGGNWAADDSICEPTDRCDLSRASDCTSLIGFRVARD